MGLLELRRVLSTSKIELLIAVIGFSACREVYSISEKAGTGVT
jgi:hypothetical protein